MLFGVLLVVAVPVALYLWLNSETGDAPVHRAPIVAHPAPTPSAGPVMAPAPVAAPAEITVPAVQVAPALPAAPVAAGTERAGATAAAPQPAAAASVLHLEFGDESWTEIKDASGRMLLRQLNPADSKLDVHGQPPFDLVIGNAPHVRMTYNGRPIELQPFIDGTVARFTLEE